MDTNESVVDIDAARERSEYAKNNDAKRQKARRHRETRLAMTEGKEEILGLLKPPLFTDNLTSSQVCDYLGISKSALLARTRIYGEELKMAGYEPGRERSTSRFSRRSVLHLALLLRPGVSSRADFVKQAFGIAKTARPAWLAGHVTACGALIAKANETAEAIHECDPVDVWDTLTRLERWQLQGLVVTLGAMLPLDQPGLLTYLAEIGRNEPRDDHTKTNNSSFSARGLAALIPVTRREFDEDEAVKQA